jgi:uncharacterized membrane protein
VVEDLHTETGASKRPRGRQAALPFERRIKGGSMDQEPMRDVPPPPQTPPPNYAYAPQQPVAASVSEGLSDTAAGALAYITLVPAIIFLIVAPYNTRPFVRFHAFQCIGLSIVWFCLSIIWIVPILGWIVGALGFLGLLVCWILSIVKASQGSAFKLPIISEFAAKQSGYQP